MRFFSFLSVLVISLVCVCSCAQFEPFIDARREAGTIVPVGSSTKEYPVVCYGLFGTPEQRQVLAQNICNETDMTAVLTDTSYFGCKLLTPVKETYHCQKTKTK